MAESEAVQVKPRPIIRIGIFIISHSLLVSLICCAAGVLALLLLPVLAKNTYISENALMPGSATPMLSSQDVLEANRFVEEITSLYLEPAGTGMLIEGVILSVNNLLEKFHQSFFLYLLTSPNKFVSVGVYMIAFALLVAPLPVVAASLYVHAYKLEQNLEKDRLTSSPPVSEPAITFRSWIWLYAAKTVFVVHLWCGVVTFLPYFIYQIPNCSPTTSLLIWFVLSVLSLLLLHLVLGSSSSIVSISQLEGKEWALLKSVTVTTAFIGLCLMSVINFATAEIGALLIVPMCLMVTPLRLDHKVHSLMASARAACNLLLVLVGFPAVAFFVLKGAFEGFDSISVSDFWYWLESLWAWNSATYIYICMVHLPCWVLCILILLHSC